MPAIRKTMRLQRSTLAWLALAAAVLITARSVASQAVGKIAAADGKVERFLDALDKARSLEEVAKAYAAGRFSSAEEAAIAAALAKPPRSQKIRALDEAAKAAAEKGTEQAMQEKLRAARQRQQEEINRQTADLKTLNLKAQAMFRELVPREQTARAKGPISPKSPLPRPLEAPQKAAAPTAKLETEGLPRITSLYPQPLAPGGGRDLFIRGSNFGRARGSVSLTIGSRRITLPIVDWDEVAIIVRPGPDLVGIAHEEIPESGRGAEVQGRVVVDAGRNSAASWIRLAIPPDPARIRPAITALSSPTITPRQELIISGSNFLEEPRRVSVVLGSRRFTAAISKWYDSVISVVIPDIRGFRAMDAAVEVENVRDLVARRPVRFLPTIVTFEQPQFRSKLMGADILSGYRARWAFHDFILQNDWTVADYYMEVAGATVSYIERPRIGGTAARALLDVRQPAFTAISIRHVIIIRGPAGVPFK